MSGGSAEPSDARAPRRVVASAPGKLILIGEHAAVYGRPALVAALGLRTRVEIEALEGEGAGGRVELDLDTLGHRETTGWAAIDDYTARYAERWRRFDADPTSRAYSELADRDPARLVKLALGEARRELVAAAGRSIRLRVASEIPVGSGFGSSASVAVAVAGAMLAFAGGLEPGAETEGWDALAAVALEVERRQHGRPSGVDHTTVLRGGILRLDGGAERRIGPLAVADRVLDSLSVFDTGRPAETTGEVVAAVRARRDSAPAAFEALLDSMETATRGFTDALTSGEDPTAGLTAVTLFERRLEELGVVPAPVRQAVREIEDLGGAAKLSGAGALTGERAGALLVCWPPGLAGEPQEALPGYPCLRAAIGAPGLRIEEAA